MYFWYMFGIANEACVVQSVGKYTQKRCDRGKNVGFLHVRTSKEADVDSSNQSLMLDPLSYYNWCNKRHGM